MKLTELSLGYVNWVTLFIEDDFMNEMHDRFGTCWILSIEKLNWWFIGYVDYLIDWNVPWFCSLKCTLTLFYALNMICHNY